MINDEKSAFSLLRSKSVLKQIRKAQQEWQGQAGCTKDCIEKSGSESLQRQPHIYRIKADYWFLAWAFPFSGSSSKLGNLHSGKLWRDILWLMVNIYWPPLFLMKGKIKYCFENDRIWFRLRRNFWAVKAYVSVVAQQSKLWTHLLLAVLWPKEKRMLPACWEIKEWTKWLQGLLPASRFGDHSRESKYNLLLGLWFPLK